LTTRDPEASMIETKLLISWRLAAESNHRPRDFRQS
jgi:hypothetical protein